MTTAGREDPWIFCRGVRLLEICLMIMLKMSFHAESLCRHPGAQARQAVQTLRWTPRN